MRRAPFSRIPLAGLIVLTLTAATLGAQVTRAAGSTASGTSPRALKAAVVLVHGAFADGSGWAKVIPILERDGYYVIAVQNPLHATPDDIANTKRVINDQMLPVILVGHSYGGVVITGAGANNPKVKALVYVAAFAPDAGEAIGPLLEKYPSKIGGALRPDSAGFLYLDRAQFHEVFCADLTVDDARIMAATQKPIAGAAFKATLTSAAWKTVPAWYMVAQDDQAINPELERVFAKRMNAKTVEVKASHVPFLSQPEAVANLIEQAAAATVK